LARRLGLYLRGDVVLKCVKCGRVGLEFDESGLKCPACSSKFPTVDGVHRFVSSEHYTGSFGYQWNRFAQAQLDSANGTTRSRDAFVEKTGFTLASLRGARVLDAGCGMGRFAEVCINAGADVHAIDLSTAVEAAARNLSHHPNVSFYQADIMGLPFADATFDFVYSIGVLHHTTNTKKAFLSLTRLVKPGGRIAIWVYSAKLRLMFGGELLRLVTPSLPKPALLSASKIAIPLYHVHRLPVLGRLTTALLPTSLNPDPEWRWLDTFDWYSPRYQWKHTYAEVEGWFREAGLTEISRESFPVSVRGLRSAQ
jgi:ubiquinone/menaquinone biosynthesis C-methylase UbiE